MAAGAILGAGIYTYIGALVTAPVCLLITWLVGWRQGQRSTKAFLAPAAGFALVLLPFIAWHLVHPEQYAGQIRMYSLYDPSELNPAEGARQLLSMASLSERLAVYWDYFNPSFLFFAGDSGLINGTRAVGIFLLPVMVLLPIGLVRLVAVHGTTPRVVVLLGLAVAPLAATLVAERYRINRALVMLPFASLVATIGVEALWSAQRRAFRVLVVVLLALMPLQFAVFSLDYFGDYRARSASWLEYNIAGGLEEILSRQPESPFPVYIDRNIQWVEYYWPLYLVKHGRPALQDQTTYFDSSSKADVSAMPARSLVLCRMADEALLLSAGFTRVATIPEPDGSSWFAVLER